MYRATQILMPFEKSESVTSRLSALMTVCVLEEGKKEKEKDFLLFFNQKCLH